MQGLCKNIDVALGVLKCDKNQSISKYRNDWILNIKDISVTTQWDTVSVELDLAVYSHSVLTTVNTEF